MSRGFLILFFLTLLFPATVSALWKGEMSPGCTTVVDNTPPVVPVLDSISVDPATGNVTLAWQPSPSPDTDGYFVYQLVNGVWLTVGTINGITSTSYTYSGGSESALNFRIAAFDSCDNVSPQGTIHKTMFIRVFQDKCTKTNKLSWNLYQGWSGISGFKIYVSKDGGAFTYLNDNAATDTTYEHSGIQPFSTYCYLIRATDNTGTKTSTAHKKCLYANVFKVPDFLYMMTATVENKNVRINVYADSSADLRYYELHRAIGTSASFKMIDTIKPDRNTSYLTYLDTAVNTSGNIYYYKVIAVDSCSIQVKTSENTVRTILLTGEPFFDLVNELYWNSFQTWDKGVAVYNLHRGPKEGVESFPFASTDTLFYKDNIKNYIIPDGIYCYYVEAQENAGNKYLISARSRSNELCLSQQPTIYVPNAFNPGGSHNPVFMPGGLFIANSDYSLLIFNRWGQKIFSSSDPAIGWDGDGAEIGVYVYSITYRNERGLVNRLNGTVTLIR